MEGTDSQIVMLTRQRLYAIPAPCQQHHKRTHQRISMEQMRRDHVCFTCGLNRRGTTRTDFRLRWGRRSRELEHPAFVDRLRVALDGGSYGS